MAPYKVLIPLDGSRLAEHSLAYLDALQSLGELQVLLLSVFDEAENSLVLNPAEARARTENLSTYLREASADVQQHLAIDVQTKVVSGSPASRILQEASAYAPDLLVITTHGRSGVTRWRLGSVADKVIRGASCDTLVVGPKAADRSAWMDARMLEPFKSLLVPLDGSPLGEAALPVAVKFAQSFHSLLHLVQVVAIPLADLGVVGTPYSLLDAVTESANKYLQKISSTISEQDVRADVLVGGASSQLEDYVTTRAIDMVIMTSHGRGGLLRTALGSVTDRMIGGPAPVLVVRPESAM